MVRVGRSSYRAAAVLSTGALALALAACGGGEETSTTASGASGTTGPTGASGPSGKKPKLALAHIDDASGSHAGLRPDTRRGELPPGVSANGDLAELADNAGCELKLDLPDEGNHHLSPNQPAPDYGTNPPTSGDHDPVPVADGAYLDTPKITQAVHSLEHGRVEIQYSPDLSESDQLALKGLFDDSPQGMLLFPDPDMPYAVAATAWTKLLGCPDYSEEALRAIAAFRDQFRGKGPEPVPL